MIDSHCHMQYINNNQDIKDILDILIDRQFKFILNVGIKGDDSLQKLQTIDYLKKYNNYLFKYKNIFIGHTIGFHPCEDIICNEEDLYNKSKNAMGMGETGIDLYHKNIPLNQQIENFNVHIRVARRLKIPVIVHCRNSEKEVSNIINNNKDVKFLLHCFSGNMDFYNSIKDCNILCSFSGNITYPVNSHIQDVVKNIPNNNFTIETDTPYLIPFNYKKQGIKKNNPTYINETIEKISTIKNISTNDVEKYSYNNFLNFFNLKDNDLKDND